MLQMLVAGLWRPSLERANPRAIHHTNRKPPVIPWSLLDTAQVPGGEGGELRGSRAERFAPDFAALHPGYDAYVEGAFSR